MRKRSSGSRATLAVLIAAGSLFATTGGLEAQERQEATAIQWWHPLAVAGGTAALFLIDEPVRDFLQDHRSDGLDDLADVPRRFKDPEVFWYGAAGTAALGLVLGEPKIAATGVHIIAGYGVSSWMMIGTKWAFGRSRPSGTPDDPTNFDWFDGGENAAFPSGSAAVVFSLATTLADAIDRTPVSIALYTGAGLNAWARLNSDRHWLSDVALGAVYGITASKLVSGRWTVFGLRPPTLWTDGRTTGLAYTVTH